MKTSKSLRSIALCADDYGLSPAVSAGIRELVDAGRLTATGAMTCMASWPAEAPALKKRDRHVQVGLHFTLTDQRPLGDLPILAPTGRFPSIGRLLQLAFSGVLSDEEIISELDRQLDAFEEHFGRPPDFIDGHQHVHLLPVVREAVMFAFGRRLDPQHIWIRDCADSPGVLLRRPASVKAGIIAVLGWPLHRSAPQLGLHTNRGFSGFYNSAERKLAAILPSLLRGARAGHLVMLHPGHIDDVLRMVDSLVAPRESEWSALIDESFPARLASLGYRIAGKEFPWNLSS